MSIFLPIAVILFGVALVLTGFSFIGGFFIGVGAALLLAFTVVYYLFINAWKW